MIWQMLDVDKFSVNAASFSCCGILHQKGFGDTTMGKRKTVRKPVTWAVGLV